MLNDDQILFKYLQDLQVIDVEALSEAFNLSVTQKIPFPKILLEKKLISDDHLGKVISELTKIPFVKLSEKSIPKEILFLIPEVVARKERIIIFNKDAGGLHLAMADPSNKTLLEFIRKKAGMPVTVYIATDKDIEEALSLYTPEISQAFETIIAENVRQTKVGQEADPPIIKIVDTIINYAYQNKASDIHIEPDGLETLIRFRIDGILHDIIKLPKQLEPQIITRIKVLSHLRTDEHQAAQDGKIQWEVMKPDGPSGEKLDIRVSIIPSTKGETAVLRLLSARARQFSLTDLGICGTDLAKIEKAYKKPYGMILSTGPTGCGKTTTMYAILKILNTRDVNIATIEDPVEYDIEGVTQIQVNLKTNLTFASGLRSIVRQDPNIILVGEIRDEETAGIAVNSAMTGHLVLSTLHTNDAATSIPRLMDMGIEPFLIASTVNIIVAQRLVRKICLKCRFSLEITRTELEKSLTASLIDAHFGIVETIRIYKGKGCPLCHQTGYEGRIGIFEVMEISEELKKAVVTKKDAGVLLETAKTNGMKTMIDDGLDKVTQGITSIEEVIRVTKE